MPIDAAAQTAPYAPRNFAGLARLGGRALIRRAIAPLPAGLPHPAAFRVRGTGLPLAWPALPGTGDAAELYRGRFRFRGTAVESSGRVIFDHQIASEDWMRELHAFGWLQALLEPERQLWRVFARTLVSDWQDRAQRLPAVSRAPAVLAARVINWTACAPQLLNGAPEGFAEKFFRSLTWQTRRLSRRALRGASPLERLHARIALCWASLGLEGLEGIRESAFARLEAELARQMLPDGGHVSRSPAVLLHIAALLSPLREALNEARLAVPPVLSATLERALPMLRLFRHGDGGLTLLGGVNDPAAGQLAAILEADAVAGKPLSHAPHSGYARLAQGASVLIADIGRPPAPGVKTAALSVGAFEFSHGPARIITSCGAPRVPSERWSRVARLTAAHSAAILGDLNAGRIYDNRLTTALFRGPALIGPARLSAAVRETSHGSLLDVAHDAYSPASGFRHERRLFLAPEGLDLRGQDTFIPDEKARVARETPFAIRFHLHPSLTATMARDGASVMLVLADKSAWTFSARDGMIRLEESVYLASGGGLRRTMQIVVEGMARAEETTICWRLRRMSAAPRRKRRKAEAATPELPLR